MQEFCEFRILEKHADLLFAPDEGQKISNLVRRIVVSTDDQRYSRIGQLQEQLRRERKGMFFAGWHFIREYTQSEMDAAELFYIHAVKTFEPAGEECGTLYDETTACSECGSGASQISELILDSRRIPKKDIARTIAGEWVVSQRLAQILLESDLTGFELRAARHKAHYKDDSLDLSSVPSGQALLEQARSLGYFPSNWKFWVWINKPEQASLGQQARREHSNLMGWHDLVQPKRYPQRYQLVSTSHNVELTEPTRFGINPFDSDPEGIYRCSAEHLAGLNSLSEIFVSRETWRGHDLTETYKYVGVRRGLLRPERLKLVSRKFRDFILSHDIEGADFEIAYLT